MEVLSKLYFRKYLHIEYQKPLPTVFSSALTSHCLSLQRKKNSKIPPPETPPRLQERGLGGEVRFFRLQNLPSLLGEGLSHFTFHTSHLNWGPGVGSFPRPEWGGVRGGAVILRTSHFTLQPNLRIFVEKKFYEPKIKDLSRYLSPKFSFC